MDINTWVMYFLSVLLLTSSPGPSALFCMTRAVSSGTLGGFIAALGSLLAITLILTLSFTGLGVLIATSELAFTLVKYLGAAYLVYLGVQSFRSKADNLAKVAANSSNKRLLTNNFFQGFIVGASNPKAIVFFTALFPQFINPNGSLLSQYSIFAITFMLLELSWLMFYVVLGVKSSNWLYRNNRMRLFNRLTGSVFISAGTLLSLSNRG
ncbi:Homoserine/homoserine lactone efflux protein [Pseudoalteromonas sp. P1-9]|uniref:LysE family translocator n=1 Tax=Pseudoalteromonas sp. P1-9 TaxID=1710354 RepID=UPI0006D6255D|nr:LysE family translocator [Pseudoalteromonas sp. P1-9]KPV93706.1 Homoserine/homoserine lactone efflux protein [Pseudoalteromonas sp. P1-9]